MIAPMYSREREDELDWEENQSRGSGCWAAAVIGFALGLILWWVL